MGGFAKPGGYHGVDAQAAARLRALPPHAVVVTDEPGFPWRAGLPVPDQLRRRVGEAVRPGPHHRPDLLRAARARERTCAVLATSDERLGRFHDLPDRLADAGYRTVLHDGATRLLYAPPD